MKWVLLIFLGLLVGCSGLEFVVEKEFEPKEVINEGFMLGAGNTKYWSELSTAGTYEIEIISSDGIDITIFPSIKDVQLAEAGSEYAEQYSNCNARESTRFVHTCRVSKGAVLAVSNPNWIREINVGVKVTQIS